MKKKTKKGKYKKRLPYVIHIKNPRVNKMYQPSKIQLKP